MENSPHQEFLRGGGYFLYIFILSQQQKHSVGVLHVTRFQSQFQIMG